MALIKILYKLYAVGVFYAAGDKQHTALSCLNKRSVQDDANARKDSKHMLNPPPLPDHTHTQTIVSLTGCISHQEPSVGQLLSPALELRTTQSFKSLQGFSFCFIEISGSNGSFCSVHPVS